MFEGLNFIMSREEFEKEKKRVFNKINRLNRFSLFDVTHKEKRCFFFTRALFRKGYFDGRIYFEIRFLTNKQVYFAKIYLYFFLESKPDRLCIKRRFNTLSEVKRFFKKEWKRIVKEIEQSFFLVDRINCIDRRLKKLEYFFEKRE